MCVERIYETRSGQPVTGIDWYVNEIHVQHPSGLRNRRMGLGRRGDLPACRSHSSSTCQRSLTGGMQSREIAKGPARYESAAGVGGEAGEAGQPVQRFILSMDCSGRFEPAAGVDPGSTDQEIEEDRN